MAKNDSESMFEIDQNMADALGVSMKSLAMTGRMTPNILNIFYLAKKNGKTELSLDEITVAYYNLYTKPEKLQHPDKDIKIKTKNDIAVKLFNLRGTKQRPGYIELVPGTRGLYRLREPQWVVAK